jgi:hypothetical protein
MLNTLNIEDRQDFEARLARHELSASLVQDRIQASGGAITRIGISSGWFKPHAIPVNSVATLTKMFGVPDQLLKKEASKNVAKVVNWQPKTKELQRLMDSKDARAVDAFKHIDFKRIHPDDQKAIHQIALGFGRGMATHIEQHRALVDAYLRGIQFQVLRWPFFNVYVGPNSVLEFDEHVHAVVAYQVTIDVGGRIHSRGSLMVDCTILKAN